MQTQQVDEDLTHGLGGCFLAGGVHSGLVAMALWRVARAGALGTLSAKKPCPPAQRGHGWHPLQPYLPTPTCSSALCPAPDLRQGALSSFSLTHPSWHRARAGNPGLDYL